VNAQLDPGDKPGRLGLLHQKPVDCSRQHEQWPGGLGESRIREPSAQVIGVVPGEVASSTVNQPGNERQDDDREEAGQGIRESIGGTAWAGRAGNRTGG
jgi:hypothetical protein